MFAVRNRNQSGLVEGDGWGIVQYRTRWGNDAVLNNNIQLTYTDYVQGGGGGGKFAKEVSFLGSLDTQRRIKSNVVNIDWLLNGTLLVNKYITQSNHTLTNHTNKNCISGHTKHTSPS